MASIKGPKSALTDYLQEKGIKIKTKQTKSIEETNKETTKTKRKKILKFEQPKELCNIKNTEEEFKLSINHNLYTSFDFNSFIPNMEVDGFIDYLCVNRYMNQLFFDYFVSIATDKFYVPDCSAIKEFGTKCSFKSIRLGFCGRLCHNQLNRMISNCPDLEELRICGAFLIKSFNLPHKLKKLDISDCSNVTDKIIEKINLKFEELDELKIDRCLNLVEPVLNTNVTSLSMNETNLSFEFLKVLSLKNFKYFSARDCKNLEIENICDFGNVEYLDLSGVTNIENLVVPKKCKVLCLENTGVKTINFSKNLTTLNISGCDLGCEEMEKIFMLSELEELNIGWSNVNDDFVVRLIDHLQIKKLWLFGCFNLSELIGKLAWEKREKIKIMGCPAETVYLLNKEF